MLKDLIKLANELDQKGLTKEADVLDSIIKESRMMDLPTEVMPRQPKDTRDALEIQRKNSKDRMEVVQLALSVAGLMPVIGEPFDAINSAIYMARNKPLEAILSAISIIPVWGDFVGKGSRLLLYAIKSGKTGLSSIKFGTKTHTVADLGSQIASQLDSNDGKIKELLAVMSKASGHKDGELYTLYQRDIKNEIKSA